MKRSSVTSDDLLLYYKSVIRLVVEYACPVGQSSLTSEQKDRLEMIQRRALFTVTGSSDYELQCVLCYFKPIKMRLDNLLRSFFNRLRNPTDCLHCTLPDSRSADVLTKL
jgi:hypothetical protein